MPQSDDLYHLIFPALLLAYYIICWLFVGRDPKIKNITPQYEPPPGVSPAVARYVLNGGSDGTTLAAVIASLAAKQMVSIQPEGKTYRIRLLDQQQVVMPEEAAVVKILFGAELKVQSYPAARTVGSNKAPAGSSALPDAGVSAQPPVSEAVLDPHAGQQVKSVIDAIQAAMSGSLRDIYFRWNSGFILAGLAATFVWAMATASRLQTPQGSPLFLTFWLFFFTTGAGVVLCGVWTSRPSRPTTAQRVQYILLPVVFFGLPGFLIYSLALPTAHGFVIALLCSVALNSIFFVLMRAPTAEGRRVLQHLAGFREFLVRVEQDRMERLNQSSTNAEVTNQLLPYAIALNVSEGWGDSLAASFSNAVVER